MSFHEKPTASDQLTKIFAAELKLSPTDSVYRYLHPVMVCGVEGSKLLLQGNKNNGTVVIDNYGRQGDGSRVRASSLPDPGLNFTRAFHAKYKSDVRRAAVSFKMADQAKGLRIYDDRGSEASSLYFTLPDGVPFKVGFEEGDLLEIGIAIYIHKLMEQIHVVEEPDYRNWTDDRNGVRVVAYVKKPEEEEQRVDVTFLKEGTTYRINPSLKDQASSLGIDLTALEMMAVYRLMLDNIDLQEVILENGSMHSRESLTAEITASHEFKVLMSL